ncbi:uncharacterized protein [Argopecten irradians]|uniref:uncharacterized protein n=1 Tax=Argopecten irradians TaxID=31199 RepID=UPI00371F02F6
MVRQSCAIGPCPEKTYKKSEGVTFLYMINVKDNDLKRAWKDRILNTRKDVRSRDELNHVAICSRHFKDGDPSNIPTIIPKIHGGEVVWPETEKPRPKVIRRALDFNDSASPPSSPPDVESEPPPSLTPKFKSELQQKLDQIRTVMTESPPKIVKEIEKRKADEINEMTPAVKSIYNQVMTSAHTSVMQSPPLKKKLKFLKEKTNKEPDGVRPHVSKSTPNAKDSLIQHLKDLLDVEMRQNADLRLQLHEKINGNVFGIEQFRCSPCDIQFYTGMPDYLTFLALCDFLQPERHKMQSLYYERKDTDSAYALNRGRDPILSIHEQLFLYYAD